MYKFKPDYTVHPKETIEELMIERNISIQSLSASIGIPVKQLQKILNTNITPIAKDLERIFKIPVSFWINKQENYNKFYRENN